MTKQNNLEIAGIGAGLNKLDYNSSGMPSELEESGLGDVECQLRWRYN